MAEPPISSVWLACQQPAPAQRLGRYVRHTAAHPAKMLPAIAAHAIDTYTVPGEIVLDPMCGAGTTLVEAVRRGRPALGIDIEARFAELAEANVRLAVADGATASADVITGDARNLVPLLPSRTWGRIALVVTSPPYGKETHGLVRSTPDKRIHKRNHLYGDRDPGNLAYLGWEQLRDGFGRIMAGCVQVLRPGGIVVFTCRPVRRTRDDLIDLPGQLLTAAMIAGLEPLHRCVAMLAAVREGRIISRTSMFALMAARRSRTAGIPVCLITHEDVYILRKPITSGQNRQAAG